MSQETRFTVLQQIQRAAHQLAPAIREMFDRAGLAPADLKTVDDLSRLPVFKKESLVELQRQRPPFGGFLAAKDEEIVRIFVSPGPINEPQLRHDRADYGYVMENGRIVLEGAAEELRNNEDVREFYLGLDLKGERKSYRDIKHYRRRKRWLG